MSLSGRIRTLLGSLIVAGSGLVQFAVCLPDRQDPTTLLRDVAIVSFLAGLPLGFFLPRSWAVYCALASWGAVAFGALALRASGPGLAVPTMLASLGAVLLGGAVGAFTRTRIEARILPAASAG